MNTPLDSDDRDETPDTVLYLGAGYGEDLEQFLALPARQIVLVEPNPDCQPTLAERANGDERVSLMPLAADGTGDRPSPAPLNVWNVSAFSSLRAPTGLRALFPGLRREATPMVDTVSIDALLTRLQLRECGKNLLIVDVPGEDVAILQRMAEADLLGPFARVILRGATGALFEKAPPAAVGLALLTEYGFRETARDESDPDFVEYRLWQDPALVENRALRAALSDRDAQRLQIAERAETAEAARQEAQAQAEALQAERDAATERAKKAEGAFGDRDARLKAAEADLAETRARLEQKESDLGVALRSQAATQSDLTDLRTRFETLSQEKVVLDDLLQQVTSRLNAASDYLHMLGQLETQAPSSDSAVLEGKTSSKRAPSRRSGTASGKGPAAGTRKKRDTKA
jgi:FkbM family methyltransferase